MPSVVVAFSCCCLQLSLPSVVVAFSCRCLQLFLPSVVPIFENNSSYHQLTGEKCIFVSQYSNSDSFLTIVSLVPNHITYVSIDRHRFSGGRVQCVWFCFCVRKYSLQYSEMISTNIPQNVHGRNIDGFSPWNARSSI